MNKSLQISAKYANIKSMLIDTHCHLHDLEWFTPEQQQDYLQKSHENGIEKIICIGTNPEDSRNAQKFATQCSGVYCTYGIHPEFTDYSITPYSEFSEQVKDLQSASPDKLVAIGEIGLDYHYDGYNREAQIRLFENMLQLALDYCLPVSLHIREAFADALAVLDNFPKVCGVVHSFTGSKRDLREALSRGFYIGANGLCTYTTNPLPPLDRMLLETDAPFLTPVPHRGQQNSPQYIKDIADFLAQSLGSSFAEVAQVTTRNAEELFSL